MHHTRIGTLGLLLLSAIGCSESGDIIKPAPEPAEASAFSSVEVAARVSEGFRHATRAPDRRDPNVSIIPA